MVKAVDKLSLTARPGEIYGLLGPNGAGKTTALRCIASLLKPTQGNIIKGYDTVEDSQSVRKTIGFLTNEISLIHSFPRYMFGFLEDFTDWMKELLKKEERNCSIILA